MQNKKKGKKRNASKETKYFKWKQKIRLENIYLPEQFKTRFQAFTLWEAVVLSRLSPCQLSPVFQKEVDFIFLIWERSQKERAILMAWGVGIDAGTVKVLRSDVWISLLFFFFSACLKRLDYHNISVDAGARSNLAFDIARII